MSKPVISVRGLGKKYRLGATIRHDTLRDQIANTFKSLFSRNGNKSGADPTKAVDQMNDFHEFWALRDVSFDVHQGEVIGIIGRNGAGKSTLLKILSEITEPTTGEIRIRGRVGSLLEVGTGFHPELTGRENIYMNGAILGMTKAEIKSRFDEIVDFSEIGKFLDTPVKRYSSGMHVRLAFAVAAHLKPEILFIDEVLAVGDIAFQKKCLGKMNEVSKNGRTILFVSHNMLAINTLCERVLLLSSGLVSADGDANDIIELYRNRSSGLQDIPLGNRTDRTGNGRLRFTSIVFSLDDNLQKAGQWVSGSPGFINLFYTSPNQKYLKNVNIAVTFYNNDGSPLFTCNNRYVNQIFPEIPPIGQISCIIPRIPLASGNYQVKIWASVSSEPADIIDNASKVSVIPGDYYGTGHFHNQSKQSPLLIDQSWKTM